MTAKCALASKRMIPQCFECTFLHLLWGEPTGEKTTQSQSLQPADNRIIKKTDPGPYLQIHYGSILKLSDFQSTSGYHCLEKLLEKAGQDHMLIQQWNEEDGQHWETKARFCLMTRESALLDLCDQAHLPRQLHFFFNQQRAKGDYRRKTGIFLLSRHMLSAKTFISDYCTMLISDQMPNFQVFLRWISSEDGA